MLILWLVVRGRRHRLLSYTSRSQRGDTCGEAFMAWKEAQSQRMHITQRDKVSLEGPSGVIEQMTLWVPISRPSIPLPDIELHLAEGAFRRSEEPR